MYLNLFCRPNGPALATLCGILCLASVPLRAGVVIDGSTTGDGYTPLHSQAQVSGWSLNALANLRYVQSGDILHLFIAGRATDNAIILFIDSKAGVGVNRIIPELIAPQPGGEDDYINNLASASNGMTFETGFNPDLAIRIYGNETDGVKVAHVNRYDLVAATHTSVGDSHAGIVSGGPIRALKTDWRTAPTTVSGYTTFSYGVEIALNLSELGVAPGAQAVKLSAILVNSSSTLGSNQVLGSLNNNFNMGTNGNVTTVDFNTDPATQTLTVDVIGLDPIQDQDGDGLLNGVETGTGIFVSADNTGSDPYKNDTDGDGYLDGVEVSGASSLGYISNPNLPNHTNIGVPGTFNLPTPWQTNGSSNDPPTAMSREATSLTGQYRWILDYKFAATQLGSLAYKFASNATPDIWWGLGDSPAAIKRDGNNIPGLVSATGFHRFFFDQAALTYTFDRRVFAGTTAFLAAYGLTSGSDFDGDGVSNENEFAANTDPTNPDSDQDGLNDMVDLQPLVAMVPARNIVFRVNMHIQVVNGDFIAGDAVKVSFFTGASSPGELTLSDPDGDDVYTGTLVGAEGSTGASFGTYKFFMNSYSSDVYEDYIDLRTFDLGPPQTDQILPTVFFNNFSTSYAYDNWSSGYDPNPGAGGDDPDGDTFSNHQEFLFGTSPIERTSSLAAMERTGDGLVIRWLERSGGASYRLEESATLAENPWPFSSATITENFTDVPENYVRKTATIPIDQPRKFIRVSGRE